MPDEPPEDEVTRHVLNVYSGVTRGRRYLPVMQGKPIPLPIGGREVDEWLHGHPSPLDRDELDACVFALDEAEREAAS